MPDGHGTAALQADSRPGGVSPMSGSPAYPSCRPERGRARGPLASSCWTLQGDRGGVNSGRLARGR